MASITCNHVYAGFLLCALVLAAMRAVLAWIVGKADAMTAEGERDDG